MAYCWRWASTALSYNSTGVTRMFGPRMKEQHVANVCSALPSLQGGGGAIRWRTKTEDCIFGSIYPSLVLKKIGREKVGAEIRSCNTRMGKPADQQDRYHTTPIFLSHGPQYVGGSIHTVPANEYKTFTWDFYHTRVHTVVGDACVRLLGLHFLLDIASCYAPTRPTFTSN